MSHLNRLYASTVTRTNADADTDSRIVVIVNQNGMDRLHYTIPDSRQEDQERGAANLYALDVSGYDIDTDRLNNSYVRIGIRGGDQWSPEHAFIWGERSERVVPIAIETSIETRLSTDSHEGNLSIPLRPVALGSSNMQINRLLMLMTTQNSKDSGTNSPVELQVTVGRNLVVDFTIPDTPQAEQERGEANFYFIPVDSSFTRAELNNGSIRLRILGSDLWRPASFFLFGLDDASGRPERLVPLVHLGTWPHGTMSTDSGEGKSSVLLSLV